VDLRDEPGDGPQIGLRRAMSDHQVIIPAQAAVV
jgi:hypothetical protein